MTQEQTKFWF